MVDDASCSFSVRKQTALAAGSAFSFPLALLIVAILAGPPPAAANDAHTADPQPSPQIVFHPDAIRFGLVPRGGAAEAVLVVTNTGSDTLRVPVVAIEGDAAISGPTGAFDLAPGASVNRFVWFNPTATGSNAGTYRMETNDPSHPTILVPITGTAVDREVRGIPVLDLMSAEIDFGAVPGLVVAETTLAVTNEGRTMLVVSEAAIEGDPAFTAPTAGFNLAPGSTMNRFIWFFPTESGERTATYRMETNDPLRPTVLVPLSGAGIMPPVLVFDPDSLDITLHSGDEATITAGLTNAGDLPTAWYALPPGSPVAPRRLLWDRSHGQAEPADALTLLDDLAALDVEVVQSFEPFGPSVLKTYDVVWMDEPSQPLSTGAAASLSGWVRDGGSVHWEASSDAALGGFQAFLDELEAGITLSSEDVPSGVAYDIRRHAATEGVSYLKVASANGRMTSVDEPSRWLVRREGAIVAALAEIGAGRVSASTSHPFSDEDIGLYDNRDHARNLVRWLAGSKWLDVHPSADSSEAGQTTPLMVRVETDGLSVGVVEDQLEFISEGPPARRRELPVRLEVLPAAAIRVSPDSVEFGETFVGAEVVDEILLRNPGSLPLTISSIQVVGSSALTVPISSATIPAGEMLALPVTFRPLTVDAHEARVDIVSDDPTDLFVSVALRGEGIPAPELTLTPDAVAVTLLSGEAAMATIEIGNSGGNELAWSLEIADDGGADLTGLRILWGNHNQDAPSTRSGLLADLEARGATVAGPEALDPITREGLADYDLLWLALPDHGWTDEEYHAVRFWTIGGGRLLIEVDSNDGVDLMNTLLDGMEAGLVLSRDNAQPGTMATFNVHPATTGIDSLYMVNPGAHLAEVSPPALRLVQDPNDLDVAALSVVGAGRVFCVTDVMFHDAWIDHADNRRFGHRIVDWLAGHLWLSAAPLGGTVPAAGIASLELGLDATARGAGAFSATLRLTTNAPDSTLVLIPVALDVTADPVLYVEPAAVAFDTLFAGQTASDSIAVVNASPDTLRILDVSVTGTDQISAVAAPSTMPPGAHDVWPVVFAPTEAGNPTGQIRIETNGVTTPVREVPVSGTALIAPVFSIAPDSLHESAVSGEVKQRTLTLSNPGGSDLRWSFDLVGPAAGRRQEADTARVHWMRAHGGFPAYPHRAMIAIWNAELVEIVESWEPLLDANLRGRDIVVCHESSDDWTTEELDAVGAWVERGGALFLEGWFPVSMAAFTRLLGHLETGLEMESVSGVWGPTSDVAPHAVTAGVETISLPSPTAGFASVAPPGYVLVRDTAGTPIVAVARRGAGRVIALGDGFLSDEYIERGDNRIFAENLVRWLLGGRWVFPSPKSGVTAAGESTEVVLTIDTGGLLGGTYDAALLVANNDPFDPEPLLPVRLDVLGVPRISVSPPSVDFDSTYVSLSEAKTLRVLNPGADSLAVEVSFAAHAGHFVVTPSAFGLPPDTGQEIVVTHVPVDPGDHDTALVLASNDPDQPTLTVPVSALGMAPPVMVPSPDTLAVSLPVGGTVDVTLHVANEGGSRLDYTLWTTSVVDSGGDRGDGTWPAAVETPLGETGEKWAMRTGAPGRAAGARSRPGEAVEEVVHDPLGEPRRSGSFPRGNRPQSDLAPPPSRVLDPVHFWSGDHMRFGLSEWGEIAAFESPHGTEHVAVHDRISGYHVSYVVDAEEVVAVAAHDVRFGLALQSFEILIDDGERVVVRARTRTVDDRVEISRTVEFHRSRRFVRVQSILENLGAEALSDLTLKEFVDWDVGGDFGSDSWDYDPDRRLVRAWDDEHAGLASFEAPHAADLDGWNDYAWRETTIDFPEGPVADFDGLALLHFDLGDMPPGSVRGVTAAYAVAPDLGALETAIDAGAAAWVTSTTTSGEVVSGEVDPVGFRFDATNVAPGTHRADVLLTSNDLVNPEMRVPVILTVTGAEAIDILPPSLPTDLPTAFAFHSPRPNPSGGRTTLRFDLPAACRVRLDVYDVAGRKVRTLADGRRDPGRFEAIWNGRDDDGRSVASGVYFVRLEAGDFRATRKILRLD